MPLADATVHLFPHPGDERRLTAPDDAIDDRDDLRHRLPLAEDHLGEAAAQLAVVVDLREAEILVRQLTETLERRVDRERAAPDAAQEAAQGSGLHGGGWAPERRIIGAS